jgi:transketolase
MTTGVKGFDLKAHPTDPTRQAYGRAVLELARRDPRVVLLAADCSRGMLEEFIKEFPGRFFNFGIAEQNMVGAAAGLASCGYLPYATSFAPFLSMRAVEQIRNDVAYPGFNVKLGGMLGGLSYGPGGATHHGVEDMTIFRAVANLVALVPADGHECHKATVAAATHEGPVHIRLGRNPEPAVYSTVFSTKYDYVIGKAVQLREGTDVTLIGAGATVIHAVWASEALLRDGIRARVLNMHTIKPVDREAIAQAARETGHIVTVEENNVLGGLGGAVAEVVVSECPVRMKILGIPDVYTTSGHEHELQVAYGINWEAIAKAARELLGR